MNKHLPFLMIILALSSKTALSETPRERLLNGVDLFDKGQYRAALSLLSTIDVRKDLDNSDDMKLALKIRAISSSESGDPKGAAESIRELYFLDANYRFDAFDTPAAVIELAARELKIIEEKNQQLALIKPSPQALPPAEEPPLITEKIVLVKPKDHMITTLFPFGINHYLLQSPIKGTVYLSLQTISLAANISAFWWKQSYLSNFGTSRLDNPNEKALFERAQTIQYIALGAFVGFLGVSIIDALINYVKNSAQNEPSSTITS